MAKEVLTTNEAAELLGIARTSLINWVARGELTSATTPGGHRRFKRSDLIDFSRKRGLQIQGGEEEATGKIQGGPVRVLLVDDDADFRQFAKECLGIAGDFEVRESTNGIEAALIVGSWLPSLVLLDLRMPQMNGEEFCRQMRGREEFKKVKIVMMTAYADEQTEREISAAGADDLICKPIGIRDFVERIRQLTAD
jgi:excisionase family DNA binding protein